MVYPLAGYNTIDDYSYEVSSEQLEVEIVLSKDLECGYETFFFATMANGDSLPSFIRFFPESLTFKVQTFRNSDAGIYNIKVIEQLIQYPQTTDDSL